MMTTNKPDGFEFDPLMFYSDPLLGSVLTLPEVMLMWKKSRRGLELAMWRDKISVRKTISGGTFLVARASVLRLWGEPKFDLTDEALSPGSFFMHSSQEIE